MSKPHTWFQWANSGLPLAPDTRAASARILRGARKSGQDIERIGPHLYRVSAMRYRIGAIIRTR